MALVTHIIFQHIHAIGEEDTATASVPLLKSSNSLHLGVVEE